MSDAEDEHLTLEPDLDDEPALHEDPKFRAPHDDPKFRAPHEGAVLAVIALGGVLGAEARYGLSRALPHGAGAWPWSTLLANIAGSALIGVLMVVLLERRTRHPLVRPFLGVGILGGFTTFSTFSLDVQHLLMADRPLVALAYAAVSLVGCLGATAAAATLTRAQITPQVAT